MPRTKRPRSPRRVRSRRSSRYSSFMTAFIDTASLDSLCPVSIPSATEISLIPAACSERTRRRISAASRESRQQPSIARPMLHANARERLIGILLLGGDDTPVLIYVTLTGQPLIIDGSEVLRIRTESSVHTK